MSVVRTPMYFLLKELIAEGDDGSAALQINFVGGGGSVGAVKHHDDVPGIFAMTGPVNTPQGAQMITQHFTADAVLTVALIPLPSMENQPGGGSNIIIPSGGSGLPS